MNRVIFQWCNDKIVNQLPMQKPHPNKPQTPPVSPIQSHLTMTAKTVMDDQTCQEFHQLIYHMLLQWAAEQGNNHISYAWNTAVQAGLTQETTWCKMQEMLLVDNFTEYYHYIANCSAITKMAKIHLDQSTGIIHYRLNHLTTTPITDNTTTALKATDLAQVTPIPASLSFPPVLHIPQHLHETFTDDIATKSQMSDIISKSVVVPTADLGFTHSLLFQEVN